MSAPEPLHVFSQADGVQRQPLADQARCSLETLLDLATRRGDPFTGCVAVEVAVQSGRLVGVTEKTRRTRT